jgi:hypothetical protein
MPAHLLVYPAAKTLHVLIWKPAHAACIHAVPACRVAAAHTTAACHTAARSAGPAASTITSTIKSIPPLALAASVNDVVADFYKSLKGTAGRKDD